MVEKKLEFEYMTRLTSDADITGSISLIFKVTVVFIHIVMCSNLYYIGDERIMCNSNSLLVITVSLE